MPAIRDECKKHQLNINEADQYGPDDRIPRFSKLIELT